MSALLGPASSLATETLGSLRRYVPKSRPSSLPAALTLGSYLLASRCSATQLLLAPAVLELRSANRCSLSIMRPARYDTKSSRPFSYLCLSRAGFRSLQLAVFP